MRRVQQNARGNPYAPPPPRIAHARAHAAIATVRTFPLAIDDLRVRMTSSWWDTSSTVLGRYFSTHGTVEVDATCIGSAELELELELLLLDEEALANMLAICKGVRGSGGWVPAPLYLAVFF